MRPFILSVHLLFAATPLFAVPLTQNSEPVAGVVLEGTTSPERYAAEELQKWINRISGATLAVRPNAGSEPLKIYLGTPETSPTIRAVVETHYRQDLEKLKGNDGFAIRLKDNQLYIFGSEPKGVLNGVYRLIERNSDLIFVREREGEEGSGTIYSKNPDFRADIVDFIEVPAFRIRALQGDPAWGARLLTRGRTRSSTKERQKEKTDRYGSLYMTQAHGVQPHEFKEHPDFFALHKGRRRNAPFYAQLCYSNQELGKLYLERVAKTGKEDPLATTFDAQHGDNWHVCECEGCTRPIVLPDGQKLTIDDPRFRSTQFFDFTNRAAELLKDTFPGQGKEMLALAYVWSNPPSAIKLSDNLSVFFAAFVRDQRRPIFDPINAQWHKSIDGWMKQHKNIEFFEYYFSSQLPWFYYPASDIIAQDLRYYQKNGVTGGMYQDGPNITSRDNDRLVESFPFTGSEFYDLSAIEFWVVSRLYWDPTLDVETLRDEFCRRAYREAAEPMRKFFATIHEAWQKEPTPCYYSDDPRMAVRHYVVEKGLTDPLRKLLDDAEAKAIHPGSKELVIRGRRLFDKWIEAEKSLGVRAILDVPYHPPATVDLLDFDAFVWKQAALIDGFSSSGSPDDAAKSKTVVKAFHDRENLYLAFECEETPEKLSVIKALPSDTKLDDWNAMDNYFVEMFFDGDQKQVGGYYQLAVGSNGNRYDGIGYSNTWSKEWSAKTLIGDKTWKVVVALPLGTIGVDITQNQQIGAMLLRSDATSWKGGNVHQPASFQTLRLLLE